VRAIRLGLRGCACYSAWLGGVFLIFGIQKLRSSKKASVPVLLDYSTGQRPNRLPTSLNVLPFPFFEVATFVPLSFFEIATFFPPFLFRGSDIFLKASKGIENIPVFHDA